MSGLLSFFYIINQINADLSELSRYQFSGWRDIFSNYSLSANTGYDWEFTITLPTGFTGLAIVDYGISVTSGNVYDLIVHPTIEDNKICVHIKNTGSAITGAKMSVLLLYKATT